MSMTSMKITRKKVQSSFHARNFSSRNPVSNIDSFSIILLNKVLNSTFGVIFIYFASSTEREQRLEWRSLTGMSILTDATIRSLTSGSLFPRIE